MSAIRTNDLTKQYGSQTVVSRIDLEVEAGEVYGFLGPNGAGKSTTIAMLLSYVHPTDGTARVLGRDVCEGSAEIKHRIGVLPEQYQLYDRLSGRKHLQFAIDSMGADGDPDALADRVGLEATAVRRSVGEYSTGMKQRLRIALALIGEPDLLVLDEPSSGLDPAGIRLLREIVLEERDRGAAVFFSSHVLEQVEEVSDRIGILVDGELRMSGDLEGLKSGTGAAVELEVETDAVSRELLTAVESIDSVTECAVTDSGPEAPFLTVSLSNSAAKADVFRAIEAYATIEDFTAEERSLESVFEEGVTEASR
ncbi:ABC transporter [Natronococcus amylolyticus DSM 10524]|uniref:ABC transporter n=1 Tax=Natronococcus amylolyticus DSM 10524 TaxID=1227497 RepID=L9XBI3_9EURY|nr:ABC transporter ATP-binding protein [Natronococcus amylolyticus]ELY58801.1 ABC transporter [Natronococcus amylolyticus DSM 10524]